MGLLHLQLPLAPSQDVAAFRGSQRVSGPRAMAQVDVTTIVIDTVIRDNLSTGCFFLIGDLLGLRLGFRMGTSWRYEPEWIFRMMI